MENLNTVWCASASSSDMLPSLMFSVELVLSSIQSENQQEQKKEALNNCYKLIWGFELPLIIVIKNMYSSLHNEAKSKT